MKPQILEFTGLRSYRSRQVVDFRDLSLVGIVGHTGAGKSSILEALYFALFGSCTWDRRNSKDLIADGGDGTLSAHLTFAARGQMWKVTRSVTRGKPSAAIHRLEHLDEGTDANSLSGEKAVTNRIRDLIGMDEITFLRSVILPQGRFQELLHLPHGQRSAVLKVLLGLDQLDKIRNLAKERHDRFDHLLQDLRRERDRLLVDPQTTAQESRLIEQRLSKELHCLNGVQDAIGQARRQKEYFASQHADFSDKLGMLHAAKKAGAAAVDELSILVQREQDIAEEESRVETERNTWQLQVDALVLELSSSRTSTSGISESGNAVNALEKMLSHIEQRNSLEQRLYEDEQEIVSIREGIEDAKSINGRTELDEQQARGVLRAAEESDNDAREQKRECDRLLSNLRTASGTRQKYQDQYDKKAVNHKDEEKKAEVAKHALHEAKEKLDRLDDDYERLRRQHSAADAATHSHPGDPCPVCKHPLPRDFVPPGSPDLKNAEGASRDARNLYQKAIKEAERTAAAADSKQKELSRIKMELENAISTLESQRLALVGKLGSFDLASADEEILTSVTKKADQAFQALKVARDSHAGAQQQKTIAAESLKNAIHTLESKEKSVRKNRDQLTECRKKISDVNSDIMPRYQPTELNEGSAQESLEAARTDFRAQQQQQQQVEIIHREIARADADLSKLEQRRQRDIRTPTARVRQRVQDVVGRYDVISALLKLPTADPGDPAADVSFQVAWAIDVIAKTSTLLSKGNIFLKELVTSINAHDQEITQLLAGTAVSTEGDLAAAITSATEERAVARKEAETAEEQTPLAEDLDMRITGVTPHVNSLKELAHLLTDAKFIGAIVKDRQQELLGTATVLLQNMTRGRFGFGYDFQIFDAQTAELRDIKTLSGGETFQASLALALAMVEQTGRSGGRAEALFLDEGFGTLDASALSEALDALNTQVQAGRLVVIISHMRAIAEHVPALLMVEKTPSGSVIRVADERQQAELAEADLYEGLHE